MKAPVFFILSLVLMTLSAHAQDQGTDSGEKVERVEVTGSHIKRVDVEGVSPVQTVTKQDLQKKGYDNLGDVVKDLNANSFGSTNTPSGNSSVPGMADVSLRGLGADNTLVLLNGQRLPQDPISGTVDINMIPMAAVERVEILKDGASAIYGSDALGGVVNIITVKDYSGTQVAATQSFSTNMAGGKQTNVSVVNGINGEKYSLVTAANFRYNQAVLSKDRFWLANSNSRLGSPGSYFSENGANEFASSGCPATDTISDGLGGSYCRFHYPNYSEEAPLINQFGVMTEGHYEASSTVRLIARASYSHRYAQTIAAPAPGEFIIPFVSAGNPILNYTPHYNPATDGFLGVDMRTLALGVRENDVYSNSFGGLVGATIQLPKDWQMDVTTNFNYVHNDNEGVHGYALCSTGGTCNSANPVAGGSALADIIATGAYNPLAPNGPLQGSSLSAAYAPSEVSHAMVTSFEVKASGDLAEMAAGPLGMAVGASITYADYHDDADAQTIGIDNQTNVLGGNGGSGAGHRTFEALYTELSLPVVAKKLELQLASRYDHFSDFGSTVNPKFGFLYHASRDLLFRGSVGTGFRAPLLSELYAGPSNASPTFIDHVACAAHPGSPYCDSQQYTVYGGSNPNLKQETSIAYNLGTIYEPTKELSFGVDFFYTKINNVPGIDYEDLTIAQQEGIFTNGQYGITVNRKPDGSISSVIAPLQNLSQIQESGIDVSASYTLTKWKFADDHNQLFFYKTSGFPGIPTRDELGWNGMPRWRNTASVAYAMSDMHIFTMYMRSIPSQLNSSRTGDITPLTTFDFSYVLKTPHWGEFTATLINILNSDPPVDGSNPVTPVNYSLYDVNGRQVVVGWKKNL